MNERRSELVADVQKALELAYDTGWECGTGDVMREVTAGRDAANEVVELVTAARDAEIREALLSSSMHDVLDEHLHGVVANGWLREVFRAGLDHIGLHGDGTGGQG